MSRPESIRILHVDDDTEFAELTAEMLEREDDRVTVRTATSAGTGLDRLDDHEFDCIISDYEMPGMNGIEFLERVREEYGTLPFILFTGKGSEEIASDAISAGVTDYLQKEAGIGQYTVLANRVANAVEQYRAKQRVRERERELARQNERFTELFEKHEATETRYRTLFENAPIVVWEEDLSEVKERVDELAAEVDDLEAYLEDDRETLLALADAIEIHDVNEYAVEHYEAPSKETLIENLDRLSTQQSYEAYKEEFLALAAGETQMTVETQAWTLDGDLKDELLHLFVPEAYAEDYSRAYVTAIDITERKERERELERERDRISALFENMAEPIAYHEFEDEEPIIKEVNPAFEEVFGVTDEEIRGRSLDDILVPEEYTTEGKRINDRVRAGEIVDTEVTRNAADGRRTFNLLSVPLAPGESGEKCFTVYTDITERKERERELELYRTMIETVPDAVYALDENFHYVTVNSAMAELTGYSKSELVGSHLSLVVDDEPIETARENRRKLLESEADVLTHEYVHRTADGEEIPVENRFRLLPSDDEFRGTAGVIRDISHRKERERQVRQHRERLEQREEKLIDLRDYTQELMYTETLAETADIALRAIEEILGFDLGAVFRQSDSQDGLLEVVEVLNQSRMEKMYGGLPAFVRDAPSGTHSALAWEVFESGESVFINDTAESERLARKSPFGSLMIYPIGRNGIVLLAATRMDAFTETEEIFLDLLTTALETAFDRLEREQNLRRQRDELERQNERLDQFASVVSHDLKNPLHVATGHLELASDECESKHLADVENALDRMDTLIEDLLTVAREGEQVQETDAVTLSEIGEKCWSNVRTDAATLNIETERAIHADPGRLKQLLENLMSNAVKHGGHEVTVRIGNLPDGFYVADDGPGIPDDESDDVFETGYSTTEDGTGFGLAIVQKIADAHDWEILVTESDDGGARFEITGVQIEE